MSYSLKNTLLAKLVSLIVKSLSFFFE
jgi:hypothetical protein